MLLLRIIIKWMFWGTLLLGPVVAFIDFITTNDEDIAYSTLKFWVILVPVFGLLHALTQWINRKNRGKIAAHILHFFKTARDDIQIARNNPQYADFATIKVYLDNMAGKESTRNKTAPELARYENISIYLGTRKDFWQKFLLSYFHAKEIFTRRIKIWYLEMEAIRRFLILTAEAGLAQGIQLRSVTTQAEEDKKKGQAVDEQAFLKKRLGLQLTINTCKEILWPWQESTAKEDKISENLAKIMTAIEAICNPVIKENQQKSA